MVRFVQAMQEKQQQELEEKFSRGKDGDAQLLEALRRMDEKIQQERKDFADELKIHQQKAVTLEEQFEMAMKRIEELERQGKHDEAAQIGQQEVLPVLASTYSKRKKLYMVLKLAKEFGKQFLIKELIRFAQTHGVNFDWILKLLNF